MHLLYVSMLALIKYYSVPLMCEKVAAALKKLQIECTVLEEGDKRLLGHTGYVCIFCIVSILFTNFFVIEFMGENGT